MLSIEIRGGELGNPAGIIPDALQTALTRSVLLLERDIKKRIPIGVTGHGRGSVASEVSLGVSIGGGESLGFGNPIGRIGSPLKHVAILDQGRRPGAKAPPTDALELWVRRKIRWSSSRGPRGGRRRLTVDEARGIAFVIARKIGKRGIKAQRFFHWSVAANEGWIREYFAAAGREIATRITNPS